MKVKSFLLLFVVIHSFAGFACTTFVLKTTNELVFGRNLDWVSDNGIIVVNKQKITKTALVLPPEKPAQWTSKYGSVTFNQFGKEFPFGGMNEKGLVVEIMLANADYPSADDRPALNELQWIQYQLDNAATIEEVVKTDQLLRISKINQELHFLLCDSDGNVAVIEFIDGRMVVRRGDDLPISVLENDLYSESLFKYKKHKTCRFTTATNMIKAYGSKPKTSAVNYSFNILDRVALSARWSIVYDIKNLKIHFKTSSNKKIRDIDLSLFDFGFKAQSKAYDLKLNNQGSINKLFVPFTSSLNKEILRDAIKSNKIVFPDEVLSQFYSYHDKCR